MRLSYRLIAFLSRTLFRIFFGYRIQGFQNIPREGRLIIAPNHQSYLDPPLLGGLVPRELHFMAKRQLFDIPLLGRLIRHLNSIPVARTGQDLVSLRLAEQALQNEGALLLFPEGTRTRTGEFLKPTGGIGLLIRQTGAPVLPVYIEGTRGAFRRLFKRTGISLTFGEPFRFASFEAEFGRGSSAYRRCAAVIMQKIAALKTAVDKK